MKLAIEIMEDDPAHNLSMALRSAVESLDTIMVIAAGADTAHLLDGGPERQLIGMAMVRAQLIGSFLMARQPNLKVVRNVR